MGLIFCEVFLACSISSSRIWFQVFYFPFRHPVNSCSSLDVPVFYLMFLAFYPSTMIRLLFEWNPSLLHLTVSNKPTFLIHGYHSYKIWHRIIFHSSKQNENPEIKKTLIGKGCCPLCSFCFFSFSILKVFAELGFPVPLYYISVSFKHRKYLFIHSTMKLLLLQMDFL